MQQQHALCLGASRGIGQAIAVSLARTGRFRGICVTARGSLQETLDLVVNAGAPASCGLAIDVLDATDCQQVCERARQALGTDFIDVVVNCAVYQGPGTLAPVMQLTPHELEKCIQGNFVSAVTIFQSALAGGMLNRNTGCLVQLISSSSSMAPTRPVSKGGWALGYVATKAAVSKILPLLKVEHFAQAPKIRYFNIEPGLVVTKDMVDKGTADMYRKWGDVPPAVCGEVVARLCGEDGEVGNRFNGLPFVYAPKLAHDLGLEIPGGFVYDERHMSRM